MNFILLAVFGTINAIIAAKKGFNPFIWFFAAGLLGLIVIALMPSANAMINNEDVDINLYEQRRKAGNIAGLIILGLVALFILVIFSLK